MCAYTTVQWSESQIDNHVPPSGWSRLFECTTDCIQIVHVFEYYHIIVHCLCCSHGVCVDLSVIRLLCAWCALTCMVHVAYARVYVACKTKSYAIITVPSIKRLSYA